MTQQNAALVEEAASASKSMETQAKGLLDQVSMFKISSQQQGEQVVELEQQLAPAKQKEAKARSDPASKGRVVKTGTNDGKWKNFKAGTLYTTALAGESTFLYFQSLTATENSDTALCGGKF